MLYALMTVRATIILCLIVAPVLNPAYHKARKAFETYGY